MLHHTVPRAAPNNKVSAPHGPLKPLARSSSIMGTLRKLVSNPFNWFEPANAGAKRARTSEAQEQPKDDDSDHQRGRKKRRIRRSPSPRAQPLTQASSGYLDVPDDLVSPPPPRPARRNRHGAGHGRSSSLFLQSSKAQAHHGRISAAANGMARTMSMDPPTQYARPTRGATPYAPPLISRDVSMESAYTPLPTIPSSSASPTRTGFNLRSHAMTPQPSGLGFGPAVLQDAYDVSEPPPLSSLMSNPMFVKPPPAPPRAKPLAQEPTLTLGSLTNVNTRGHSPMRQYSTLLIGRSMSDAPKSSILRPVNSAEKALHDLDVYKTPLLPTRLRGSPTIPDMFKAKKLSKPVPMNKSPDHKPRLGLSPKAKETEEGGAGAKPYSGRGGMKKMLLKRQAEEEQDREREQEAVIVDDSHEDEVKETASSRGHPSDPAAEATSDVRRLVPDFSAIPTSQRPSSLRVGRTNKFRNHSSAITLSKNRFSAAFEEEDDDEMHTDDGPEESPKRPEPMYKPPPGFSFAKDTSPIKLDSQNAKEPPIAALPFSLSSSSRPSASSVPINHTNGSRDAELPAFDFARTNTQSATIVPTGAAGHVPDASAMVPSTPVLRTLPQIALIPPTPVPPASTAASTAAPPPSVKPAPSESLLSAGENAKGTPVLGTAAAPEKPAIPNFFANSAIFSKPGVTITPPSMPFFSKPASPPKGEASSAAPLSIFGAASQPPENKPSSGTETGARSFGAIGGPNSAFGISAQSTGGATTSEPGGSSTNPSSAPLFGKIAPPMSGTSPAVPASLGGPDKAAEKPAVSPFSVGVAAKPSETSAPITTLPFSFGAPAKPSESTASSVPSVFGSSAATKPAEGSAQPSTTSLGPPAQISMPATGSSQSLSFGGPAAKADSAPAEQPKASPFIFGGSNNTATTANTNTTKSPFIFGQPSAASAPSVQAPKPSFGSGGFPSASSSAAAPSTPEPAKSPFFFGTTPPVVSAEKPAFTFGAPAAPSAPSAGPSSFGTPSGSGGAPTSSNPFVFGAPATTPAQPKTPPRNDEEVNMDESPTRGAGMDVNGSGDGIVTAPAKEPLKVTTRFTFGAPGSASTSSPFGQTNQTTSAPYSFGASSSPFGANLEAKSNAAPPTGFSAFGQQTSSGFPFGQKQAEASQSSLSPSPFGSTTTAFGQSSATPSTTPTFAFGASAASGNAFGQPSANTTSTPASPSTFNSSSPFGFGATPTSAAAPSNPFAFGSQPASPAATNTGLPSASGASPATFAFGRPGSAGTAPSASPFGAPAAPPPAGETPLFTIGSAPSAAPGTAVGSRPVKKLPNRRGGKR